MGVTNGLHPLCVCSKCSEFCGEFKCACKTGGGNSPLTFPTKPSPPPPKSGCWGLDPQWVNCFQKPHICVFKMMSLTAGSFWGMYVGVPGTPPPHQGPPTLPRNPPPPPLNAARGQGAFAPRLQSPALAPNRLRIPANPRLLSVKCRWPTRRRLDANSHRWSDGCSCWHAIPRVTRKTSGRCWVCASFAACDHGAMGEVRVQKPARACFQECSRPPCHTLPATPRCPCPQSRGVL